MITRGNPQSAIMRNLSKTLTQSSTDHVILPGISPIYFVYLSVIVSIQLFPFTRHGSPRMKSSVIVWYGTAGLKIGCSVLYDR